MKQSSLFTPKRMCACCDAEFPQMVREPVPGEPTLLAISFVIYGKGEGKAKTVGAPKVNVCSRCMPLIIAPSMFGHSGEAKRFLSAAKNSLQKGYSAVLGEQETLACR